MSFLEPEARFGLGTSRDALGNEKNQTQIFLADSYTGSVTFKCNYRAVTEQEGKFKVSSPKNK